MTEEYRAHVEALREREESGESLAPEERSALDAFYARVEADEAVRLAPQRALRKKENAAHARYLAGLEAVLAQKRDSLQRLEKLVQEIEAIQQEESRLLAAVRG